MYNKYMKFNEKNVIVEDVLSNDEIEQIYQILKNPHRQYINEIFNQEIADFKLPDIIKNKVIKVCEQISETSGLEIAEYQFARYSNTKNNDGTTSRPKLFPHFDETFAEPRFTFDYQIGGNATWPIVVEEKEFVLDNNQALTFAGTHQVHWRTKKIFQDYEYIDMIFFHLKEKNALPKAEDVNDIVSKKVEQYRKKYDNE